MGSTDDNDAKELTRKLFWAVTSTIPRLSKGQRSSTFTWAANLAERILADCHPSLPPTVAKKGTKRYHGQAEGRGGGRINPSITRNGPAPPSPIKQAEFEKRQVGMRERAWAYVLAGRVNGRQLPIPDEVYRDVGGPQQVP